MRINTYDLRLNEDRVTTLFKESSQNYSAMTALNATEKVPKLMNDVFDLKNKPEERVYMIALSISFKVMGVFEISSGDLGSASLSIRKIFSRALIVGAYQIIIVHNHPSGQAYPSHEDREATKKLIEAGRLLGVHLTDHVIVAENDYFSFADNGEMVDLAK